MRLEETRVVDRTLEEVFDYTADLDFKGWMAVVAPLVPGRLKKVGEKALDGLVGVLGR